MAGFIFGGNTPWTYDELQRKRAVAESLLAGAGSAPRNVGEGLNAIGKALAYRGIEKRATKEEARMRDEFNAKWGTAFGGMPGMGGPSGGGTPSGTWTPDPPQPNALEVAQGTMEGGMSFPNMPKADLGGASGMGNAGLSFGSATMTPQEMLIAGAEANGLDPIDVATAISYETGGKFDPLLSGPTTQWGTHRGLIQFGEPQAAEHGVDFSDPNSAWRSQLDPTSGAVWQYLKDAGVQPGMGLDQIYSAINAGGVNRFGASDANNGGAPGTVADKVAGMGDHRVKAAEFLGGTWTPNGGGQPVSASSSGTMPQMDMAALIGLTSDPSFALASPQQKAIVEALIGQQMAAMDPMRQMELEMAQLELAQMKNPEPEPGFTQLTADEVAALGLPPGVYQRGPDGRIDTVEKTQGVVDPIADLRARAVAAGLIEGTPEFQQFMLNNGKTPDGMVIESDGQGGFRMIQGAGAASAKPFTEGQSKDVVFATRAQGALDALEPVAGTLTDRSDVALGYVPFGFGADYQSPEYQVAETAGNEFLQAILRKDTGAAITDQEQALYGETYLPRPGDGPERLAYKSEARKRAVDALEAGMSPAQIVAQEKALAAGLPPPSVSPTGNTTSSGVTWSVEP